MTRWEDRFSEYLRRYCKSNDVTQEEAIQHKLVQEVRKQYEKTGDVDDLAIPNSEWTDSGCCK